MNVPLSVVSVGSLPIPLSMRISLTLRWERGSGIHDAGYGQADGPAGM